MILIIIQINNNSNEENNNKISIFEEFPFQKSNFSEEEKNSFILDLLNLNNIDNEDFNNNNNNNNNNFLQNENLNSISFTDKKIESSNINIISEENYFNNN